MYQKFIAEFFGSRHINADHAWSVWREKCLSPRDVALKIATGIEAGFEQLPPCEHYTRFIADLRLGIYDGKIQGLLGYY